MEYLERARDWEDDAKCNGLKPETIDALFFLGRGQSPKAAQKFCSGCVVKNQCLVKALEREERGIWAGTTELDRELMKKHEKIIVTSHLITSQTTVIKKSKPTVTLISTHETQLEIGLFELEGPDETELLELDAS